MSRPPSPLLHHTVHRNDPDADWVVLVHGAGVTSEIWPDQIEAYREEFNLLLPDLRGHGRSVGLDEGGEPHTFERAGRDILDLMDHHGIRSAHFVGISMGCLIAQTVADLEPGRVRSMVLAGAITRLDLRARFLIAMAHVLKHVLPHMWLYRLYAWILLPRRGHGPSRRTMLRHARELTRAEFMRWLPATGELPDMVRRFESHDPPIPRLYIMGDQDHLFIEGARAVATKHRHASIHVFEDCGHVCTLQRPEAFNEVSLGFLRGG